MTSPYKEVRQHTDTHTQYFRDIHRHLEDLDNRGQGHNMRVRGLPETVEHSRLNQAVSATSNDLLGLPSDTPIEMERIQRALRPTS